MSNDLNIVYKISADITGLKQGVDRAATATEGLQSAATKLSTVIAGAFTVPAVVAFGKELLKDADALVKLSDKTGLSTQALQKFQIAGDDAGNSIEELAAATTKMLDLMASNDPAFLKALVDLKINAAEFKALKPEDQMIALSDALRQVKDPAEQVRLSIDTMGKSGALVLPTMKRGFDDLRDAAVGMSDHTVRSLDHFGDATAKVFRQLKADIGTAIVDFVDLAAAAAKGGEGSLIEAVATERVVEARMKTLQARIDVLAAAARAQQTLSQEGPGFMGPVEDTATETERHRLEMAKDEEATKKAADATKKWRDALKEVQSPLNSTILGLDGVTVGIVDNNEAEFAWIKASLGVADALDGVEGHTIAASGVLQDFTADLRKVGIATDDIGFKLDDLIPFDWEGQHQMIEAAANDVRTFSGTLHTAFDDVATILDNISGKWAEFGAIVARTGEAIVDRLASGDVLGAVVAGATGVISAIGKLFDGDKVQKEVNKTRQAFVDAAGGLDALNRHAHDVGLTLDAFLNARDVEEYTAAVDALTAAFDHLADIHSAAGAFGLSQSQLEAAAQKAHEVFDFMVKDGGYTAEQLGKAFRAFQEALAAAGDVAAQAWLKANAAADAAGTTAEKATSKQEEALKALMTQRDSIAQSYANEAPEEVMGSIEAAARAQVAALDTQIAQQQLAMKDAAEAAAAAIKDTVGGAADETQEHLHAAIDDGLSGAGIAADGARSAIDGAFADFQIRIPVVFDDGGGYNGSGGITWHPPGTRPDGEAPEAVMGVFESHLKGFAGGGYVPPVLLASGGMLGHGTDTVPAWLTPGELVLTKGQQRSLAEGRADMQHVGDVHIDINLDSIPIGGALVRNARFDKRGFGTGMKQALGIPR